MAGKLYQAEQAFDGFKLGELIFPRQLQVDDIPALVEKGMLSEVPSDPDAAELHVLKRRVRDLEAKLSSPGAA